MTAQEAIHFVKKRYPKAKLVRYGPLFRRRYTVENVEGHAFTFEGKLSTYVRPERAWKRIALRIKRRESR